MADIGSLVVKIAADASQLTRELDKIAQGGKQASRAIENASKIMLGALLSAAAGVTYMTIQAGKQAEELENLSEVTGINTDKLQDYDFVMNQVGLTGQDMALMMKNLSLSLEQARNNSGDAAFRFRQLGIDINSIRGTDDLFRKVATAVDGFRAGTERTNIAGDLLGKGAVRLIPLFKDLSKQLDEAAQSTTKLSELNIKTLSEMDNQIDKAQTSLKRFGQQVGVAFAPAGDVLARFSQWILDISTNALQRMNEWLDILAIKLTHFFLKVQEISEMKIADFFKPEMVEALSARLAMINREMEKQIALREQLNPRKFFGPPKPEVTKPEAPSLTDVGKGRKPAPFVITGPEQIKGLAILERSQAIYKANLDAQKEDVKQLLRRNEISELFGITLEEQLANEQQGIQIREQNIKDFKERFQDLEAEKALREAIAEEQAVYYQRDSDFSDKAMVARRVAIEAQMAGEALATAQLDEQLALREISEKEHAEKLRIIQMKGNTERMKIADQYPTFWEKQLNDLQASNVFSMGQMVSTWSSSIATMVVRGGDLKAAWESTQIAIVQAGINMAVSMAASAAKAALANEAAATASGSAWAAMSSGMATAMGVIAAAAKSLWVDAILPALVAIGEAIMGFLSAVAAAMKATIFGIPVGVAILIGVAAIGAALIAMKAIKLGKGGIVNEPTLAMIGEAGPEAVIPLSGSRGLGGGGMQTINVPVYLDGRQIARATARHTMSAWRWEGAGA